MTNPNTPSQSTVMAVPQKSNQKLKQHSQRGNRPFIKNTSEKKTSRDEKRKRWAKRAKPQQKSVVPRKGPEKEYISACCSVPARKPAAGQKETVRDAETGKSKDKPKGLGHWRCGQCGKSCKVTPRKSEAKVVTIDMVAVELRTIQELSLEVPNAQVKA